MAPRTAWDNGIGTACMLFVAVASVLAFAWMCSHAPPLFGVESVPGPTPVIRQVASASTMSMVDAWMNELCKEWAPQYSWFDSDTQTCTLGESLDP